MGASPMLTCAWARRPCYETSTDCFHDTDAGRHLRHALFRVDACALDGAGDQSHDGIQMPKHRTSELAGDEGARLNLLNCLLQFVAQTQQRSLSISSTFRESSDRHFAGETILPRELSHDRSPAKW